MINALSSTKNRISNIVMMLSLFVLAAVPVAMETLDMAGFMDTEKMFEYANVLLAAFGTLVMLVVGFHLAKVVIRFVINLFNNFSI